MQEGVLRDPEPPFNAAEKKKTWQQKKPLPCDHAWISKKRKLGEREMQGTEESEAKVGSREAMDQRVGTKHHRANGWLTRAAESFPSTRDRRARLS